MIVVFFNFKFGNFKIIQIILVFFLAQQLKKGVNFIKNTQITFGYYYIVINLPNGKQTLPF